MVKKRRKCSNRGCTARAQIRVSVRPVGGVESQGEHCPPHALEVVQDRFGQITGPSHSRIFIAPLGE
jgi:hypothetical protein